MKQVVQAATRRYRPIGHQFSAFVEFYQSLPQLDRTDGRR